MSEIVLKRNKDASLIRKHPWVFSGAIGQKPEDIKDGEIVSVYNYDKKYLGTGHFQDGSIQVRICRFDEGTLDQAFWNERLQSAYDYRKQWILSILEETNCFRLIHGEGDGLPGLVVDIYNKTAVVQCHSIGMYRQRQIIKEALLSIKELALNNIYCKSKNTLPKQYGAGDKDEFLAGAATQDIVMENGHQFFVDWELGQKTGFFLDQRENRNLLATYAKDKSVLNTFCYSGGFSVYALAAGAAKVHSVDVSSKAMDWTNKNIELNKKNIDRHQSTCQDTQQFFKENEETYDIVIVDPPAFAKNIKKRHQAVIGYKNLNAKAIRRVKPGGLLFTFSCSQVVSAPLFQNTIVAAAHEANRQGRIIHRLAQPGDHPVNLFHPEGSYLKGLVIQL